MATLGVPGVGSLWGAIGKVAAGIWGSSWRLAGEMVPFQVDLRFALGGEVAIHPPWLAEPGTGAIARFAVGKEA